MKARNGVVYAYEPDPKNYQLIQENINLNAIRNIHCFNQAVSNESGKKILNICNVFSNHSFYIDLCNNRWKFIKSIEVPTLTLRQIIEGNDLARVDFLKIDCQGAEYEIFYSCPEEILQKIEKISVEYHVIDQDRNGRKLKDYLAAKGYGIQDGPEILSGMSGMIYASR